jgi:Cu-processing system permease protein
MFSLEDNEAKGLLSLLNLILLNVPLVAIIFSTIYIYNSSEFIELLISQPIKRNKIWISLYLGLNTSLIISFIIGAGIPILLYSPNLIGIILIVMGCIISVIFTSLAFLCSIIARDKAKGIGMSILIWLFFSLLFDGLIMFLLFVKNSNPTATRPIRYAWVYRSSIQTNIWHRLGNILFLLTFSFMDDYPFYDFTKKIQQERSLNSRRN